MFWRAVLIYICKQEKQINVRRDIMKLFIRTLILLEELFTYLIIFVIIFSLLWFLIFKANDQYNNKLDQYRSQNDQQIIVKYDII